MPIRPAITIVLAAALGTPAPSLARPGETPAKPTAAKADAAAEPITQSTPTAEAIVALLEQGDGFTSDDQRTEAEAVVRAAAAREPKVSRWRFGLAMFQRLHGEKIAARDALRTLAESEPKVAAYQFWYGSAIFESMSEMGAFSQMTWNGTGRAALQDAAVLDPDNPFYRFGLAQYYINAPGIAGGSYAKAAEQAQAMLALPDGHGEFMARMTLGSIAASKEDWPEVDRQFTLAEVARGFATSRENALQSYAQVLLMRKKDPDAALPIIERLAQVAKPDSTAPHYYLGLARQQKKDYPAAINAFEKVLSLAPEAKNTRFALAQCYQALGNNADALVHFEEFATRFPKDAKAPQATAEAKKIRKTMQR